MSYANMDGVPTQTAGTSEILASDWNTYVRDNFDSIKFGHIVCTSSTRPTGIAEGTMIFETDSNKVLVYSGSAWVEVSDLDSTGGLSAASYNTFKNVVSATTSTQVLISTSTFTDSGITASITPSSSSSKVLIMISATCFVVRADFLAPARFKLLRDSTALFTDTINERAYIIAGRSSVGTGEQVGVGSTHGITWLDSPNTTSSVTYKLQGMNNGEGNMRFQPYSGVTSSIVLMEIMV